MTTNYSLEMQNFQDIILIYGVLDILRLFVICYPIMLSWIHRFMRKTVRKHIYTCPKWKKTRCQGHIHRNKYLLNGYLAELESTLKNNKQASLIYFYLAFTFVFLSILWFHIISNLFILLPTVESGQWKPCCLSSEAGSEFEDVNLQLQLERQGAGETVIS